MKICNINKLIILIIISILNSNCSINSKLTAKNIESINLAYVDYDIRSWDNIDVSEEHWGLLINELKNSKYSYREGLFIRRNPGIDVYKINILNNNKETNILIFRTGLFMIKNVFYSLNSKNKTFGIIDEIINNSRK